MLGHWAAAATSRQQLRRALGAVLLLVVLPRPLGVARARRHRAQGESPPPPSPSALAARRARARIVAAARARPRCSDRTLSRPPAPPQARDELLRAHANQLAMEQHRRRARARLAHAIFSAWRDHACGRGQRRRLSIASSVALRRSRGFAVWRLRYALSSHSRLLREAAYSHLLRAVRLRAWRWWAWLAARTARCAGALVVLTQRREYGTLLRVRASPPRLPPPLANALLAARSAPYEAPMVLRQVVQGGGRCCSDSGTRWWWLARTGPRTRQAAAGSAGAWRLSSGAAGGAPRQLARRAGLAAAGARAGGGLPGLADPRSAPGCSARPRRPVRQRGGLLPAAPGRARLLPLAALSWSRNWEKPGRLGSEQQARLLAGPGRAVGREPGRERETPGRGRGGRRGESADARGLRARAAQRQRAMASMLRQSRHPLSEPREARRGLAPSVPGARHRPRASRWRSRWESTSSRPPPRGTRRPQRGACASSRRTAAADSCPSRTFSPGGDRRPRRHVTADAGCVTLARFFRGRLDS